MTGTAKKKRKLKKEKKKTQNSHTRKQNTKACRRTKRPKTHSILAQNIYTVYHFPLQNKIHIEYEFAKCQCYHIPAKRPLLHVKNLKH